MLKAVDDFNIDVSRSRMVNVSGRRVQEVIVGKSADFGQTDAIESLFEFTNAHLGE